MRSTSAGGTKSISEVVPYEVVVAPTRTPVPCGPASDQDLLLGEAAVVVQRRRSLGDDVLLLLVGGQVGDLLGHLAVDHLAVGSLDEAVLVDPGVGGQRADQADVRALGGLDGAHAAVVGGVHVTDLEPGPLAGQAARPEGGQAPLVGQARQRVVLVHELAELAGAEELLDRGDHRSDVDQGLRGDGLHVLGGHPLADHPLHAGQAHPDLVLDELAHRPDAAVGEVVLVVDPVGRLAVGHVLGQVEHVGGGGQDLRRAEDALGGRGPLEVDLQDVRDPLDLRARASGSACSGPPGSGRSAWG